MNKIILLLTVIFIATVFSVKATVLTVSNTNDVVAQYSSIDDAVNAASDGDSIYVNGSPTAYSIPILTKGLTIIGAGYNPGTPNLTPTRIGGGLRYFRADNLTFIGIKFDGSPLSFQYERKNIIINRCYFDNSNLFFGDAGNSSNIIVNNCIFNSSYITGNNNTNNCIISNNIFYNTAYVSDFYSGSVIISNNVFWEGNEYVPSLGALSYSKISNNVFYGTNGPYTFVNCSNNNFQNNMGYQVPTMPPTGNSGSNNINAQDPNFVTSSFTSFDYTIDFHLQSGSSAIGAGTDGTDLGIYGGSMPFPDYSGEAQLPANRQFDINNPIVGTNGELKFQVHAVKKN